MALNATRLKDALKLAIDAIPRVDAAGNPMPVNNDQILLAISTAIVNEINIGHISTVYATHTHVGSPTAALGPVSPTGAPIPAP